MNLKDKFVIENKIIKGVSFPYPDTTSEFGQIFLDIFEKNPQHVIQVK